MELTDDRGKQIVVGVVYRHIRNKENAEEIKELCQVKKPNGANQFLIDFITITEKIEKEGKTFYVLGDFNIRLEKSKNPEYKKSLEKFKYKRLITEATTHEETLIDHIYTNDFLNKDFVLAGVAKDLKPVVKKHFPIYCFIPNTTFFCNLESNLIIDPKTFFQLKRKLFQKEIVLQSMEHSYDNYPIMHYQDTYSLLLSQLKSLYIQFSAIAMEFKILVEFFENFKFAKSVKRNGQLIIKIFNRIKYLSLKSHRKMIFPDNDDVITSVLNYIQKISNLLYVMNISELINNLNSPKYADGIVDSSANRLYCDPDSNRCDSDSDKNSDGCDSGSNENSDGCHSDSKENSDGCHSDGDENSDGCHSDSDENSDGCHSDSDENSDGCHSDSDENSDGCHSDSDENSDGCHSDSEENSDGCHSDSDENSDGCHSDSDENSDGCHSDGDENSDGCHSDGDENSDGCHSDGDENSDGCHSDSDENSDGCHSDSDENSDGCHSDSDENSDGCHSDSEENSDGCHSDSDENSDGCHSDSEENSDGCHSDSDENSDGCHSDGDENSDGCHSDGDENSDGCHSDGDENSDGCHSDGDENSDGCHSDSNKDSKLCDLIEEPIKWNELNSEEPGSEELNNHLRQTSLKCKEKVSVLKKKEPKTFQKEQHCKLFKKAMKGYDNEKIKLSEFRNKMQKPIEESGNSFENFEKFLLKISSVKCLRVETFLDKLENLHKQLQIEMEETKNVLVIYVSRATRSALKN